jgi:hypothetical protein
VTETPDQPALPPLLAAARALELDRDAASSGESDDYRRGMTRAVKLLRLLNEEEPAGPAPATDRAADARARALHGPDTNGECTHCRHSYDPCPTILALGAEPAVDRAALVELGAEAIWARYPDAEPSRTGLVMTNPHAAAAAVLAVLNGEEASRD